MRLQPAGSRAVVPLCLFVSLAVLSQPPAAAGQANALAVSSAGPIGELATREQANEIRIVFSEPMVVLGRIADPVTAPFVRVRPAVRGTFRWSGTTILIFTPDPRHPLPYATPFEVTVGTDATAISGHKLAAPYRFRFTTPPVRLLSTTWFREDKYTSPIRICMRFNQPVKPADVLAHARANLMKHPFEESVIPPSGVERLRQSDPAGLKRFQDKVAAARAASDSETALTLAIPASPDRLNRCSPQPDLVTLTTTQVPVPESWIQLQLDAALPSPAGPAVPGKTQTHTLELEPAFFVKGFACQAACDPEDHNPARFRGSVHVKDWTKAVTASDVTVRGRSVPVKPSTKTREAEYDLMPELTLEDAGFDRQPAAHTYLVRVDPGLVAEDGQTLGYPWVGEIENWHDRAFTSFGDGHGVWEATGGSVLPFYARNFLNVTQWLAPVAPGVLMSTILSLQPNFTRVPPTPGTERKLPVTADKIQSHGIDMSAALGGSKTGLVWAGIREGSPIARSHVWKANRESSTIVQVTNLGITVKDSPDSTLVFVTRLDNGQPVDGAAVSIVGTDQKVFWKGTTGTDGVAMAPGIPFPRDTWQLAFIVVAEKDGDLAYVASDWTEGISPWEFGVRYDRFEAKPLLRGSVFSDRGVYRLGEEVHFKTIVRRDTPKGIELLEPGTNIYVSVTDGEGKEIDRRALKSNDWSSAEWTLKLPERGQLGTYTVAVDLKGPRKEAASALEAAKKRQNNDEQPWRERITGSFLVAAYRRPEFRVDVSAGATPPIAGATIDGVITARYLFGAPMSNRPVSYKIYREPDYEIPAPIRNTFPDDRFAFGAWKSEQREVVSSDDVTLDASGERRVEYATPVDSGYPYAYTVEGDVEDVSRQHIAGRTTVVVHPAPWYIGVQRPSSYFVQAKTGLTTAIVAVTPDGVATPGVAVQVSLSRRQWHSVRRAEGNGFYTWESTTQDVDAGSWTVTTASTPVPLAVPLPAGGEYRLTATAGDAEGHKTITEVSFYALGDGYTAWARYDHNRIDLVPERQKWRPGDTARIMIQSPWEQATALVTTEREGVRSHRQFALTSTQQTVTVPITEADIPNVYVSVLLIKGRTKAEGDQDGSDPGKPSFRLGYTELKVEDAVKRLSVVVKANKEEYRPAGAAEVDIQVKDARGRPAPSEVTLWAVDYGVLSLTAYRTPDVLSSVYVEKALQVTTTDNRQRIVSRRVLTPKGGDEGGGGGSEEGVSSIRKDFRVLAFWLGSVETDANGRATTRVTLPESLTTYRIMAVGGDRQSRFGSGQSEIRINKPVLLRAAFPRFLAAGDRASFGAVITNQLARGGRALVTIQSLDPAVIDFGTTAKQTVDVPAKGTLEVRFDATARAIGRARVRMSVRLGSEGDAFEESIPVEVLASKETVAAYGIANPSSTEAIEYPASVLPNVGGLDVQLSSTAMVGLGEGARYLVDYPYGCAEQRSSRALALIYAADLGDAFKLPGIAGSEIRPVVQANVDELRDFQCSDGGFAFWKGSCQTGSPYLTSYVLHVLQTAGRFKYRVDADVLKAAASYLDRQLAAEKPPNESWWPAYTAWQAFAVKVLAEGGLNEDSNVTRLYQYRDRMPVFALAHLYDAIARKGAADERLEDLARRISNAILPEGGASHVEELADPYLLYFWNSNVRSTAIVLDTLVNHGLNEPAVRSIVRWLLQARKKGRWGETQQNAWALAALVDYYKRYEAETPDFKAIVKLGSDAIAQAAFTGRSAEAVTKSVPMADLSKRLKPGERRDLLFTREGTGTLYYAARLQYVNVATDVREMDAGFRVTRRYERLVNERPDAAGLAFKAGDLVRVTLSFDLPKERRFVAVTDPIPAGFEPIESWFATTAVALAEQQDQEPTSSSWFDWWRRGGFDHVERHDDRVQLFATRLSEGHHEFAYIVRATTAGTFATSPTHVEEMYDPEVFGRTAAVTVDVKR